MVTSVGCSAVYTSLPQNTLEYLSAHANTRPDPCTHCHKLNHRQDIQRLKTPTTSTAIEKEDKKLSPQQVATSKTEMCPPTIYTGRVLSWLPSGLWFFQSLHHHYHHIPKETGRVLSHGSVGCVTGPVSPLERHQAWQFRKAQGWAERTCACQNRNALPSFGSDPIMTT